MVHTASIILARDQEAQARKQAEHALRMSEATSSRRGRGVRAKQTERRRG
jgi:hypothetical protein